MLLLPSSRLAWSSLPSDDWREVLWPSHLWAIGKEGERKISADIWLWLAPAQRRVCGLDIGAPQGWIFVFQLWEVNPSASGVAHLAVSAPSTKKVWNEGLWPDLKKPISFQDHPIPGSPSVRASLSESTSSGLFCLNIQIIQTEHLFQDNGKPRALPSISQDSAWGFIFSWSYSPSNSCPYEILDSHLPFVPLSPPLCWGSCTSSLLSCLKFRLQPILLLPKQH